MHLCPSPSSFSFFPSTLGTNELYVHTLVRYLCNLWHVHLKEKCVFVLWLHYIILYFSTTWTKRYTSMEIS